METETTYNAPWGWMLKLLSLLTVVVLVGVTTPLFFLIGEKPVYVGSGILLAPLALIIAALLLFEGTR